MGISPLAPKPKPTSELTGQALATRERRLPRVIKTAELKAQGLSQRQIGEKLGVSARTVSRDLDIFVADFSSTDMAKLIDTMDYIVVDKLMRHWLPIATSGDEQSMEAAHFVAKLIEVRRNSFGMRRSKPGPVPNVNLYQQINVDSLKDKTDRELEEMLEAQIVDE